MKPINIGIAGLGNVGEEVAYQLIKGFRVQKNLFQIELIAVSARSKNKKRKVDINNLKFFDKQFKIIKTNICIDSLSQYEEILLIGSGKGVSTVKSIKDKNWNRKNYKSYENFMKKYKSKIMQQKILSNYL